MDRRLYRRRRPAARLPSWQFRAHDNQSLQLTCHLFMFNLLWMAPAAACPRPAAARWARLAGKQREWRCFDLRFVNCCFGPWLLGWWRIGW